jgi:hypothetical protein
MPVLAPSVSACRTVGHALLRAIGDPGRDVFRARPTRGAPMLRRPRLRPCRVAGSRRDAGGRAPRPGRPGDPRREAAQATDPLAEAAEAGLGIRDDGRGLAVPRPHRSVPTATRGCSWTWTAYDPYAGAPPPTESTDLREMSQTVGRGGARGRPTAATVAGGTPWRGGLLAAGRSRLDWFPPGYPPRVVELLLDRAVEVSGLALRGSTVEAKGAALDCHDLDAARTGVAPGLAARPTTAWSARLNVLAMSIAGWRPA